MAFLRIGDLLYKQDFKLGPESRTDRDNGDHSFHATCFLYGGTPFQAIILGVLKSVVRLNDTDKTAISEKIWDEVMTTTVLALSPRCHVLFILEGQIGDLMRCTVVMQLECSGDKGCEVYDRIYRLKANLTKRIR
ncbi:hypothetical protein B0H13DRAFT_2271439 [Mycena leptocephala]|nr:hypothetical protein B0H13DRAFT_2271439 [Mycena leptocephala]